MGIFSNFFKRKSSNSYSQNEIDIVTSSAQRLVEIINQSLTLANESNNPETKISRLNVAKNKLTEIKELSAQNPFLTLTSLNEVEFSITKLELEFTMAGYEEAANGNVRGETLEKDGKIREAIIEYEKLVARKVDTPFTYRRLAILYRKGKREQDEVRVIQAALDNVPKRNSKHYDWFKSRLDKINK
ncbi:tetratricopeptide repeat protein [Psychromonas sp. PT13]|uniref:tetratricopeptide repeat protein n=1 Tax=Psychromonas sp. PT13 TaxID=3439547 RepID=UPI003EBBAEBF